MRRACAAGSIIAAMGSYRIVVRGELGGALAQAFEGVRVEAGSGQSVLTGDFADQAQLHGVLAQLRDFGIELVEVTPGDEPRGSAGIGAG